MQRYQNDQAISNNPVSEWWRKLQFSLNRDFGHRKLEPFATNLTAWGHPEVGFIWTDGCVFEAFMYVPADESDKAKVGDPAAQNLQQVPPTSPRVPVPPSAALPQPTVTGMRMCNVNIPSGKGWMEAARQCHVEVKYADNLKNANGGRVLQSGKTTVIIPQLP